MPAAMPRHALDPATSIASKAATSATENTNSRMKAVLSKTTHGLSTSTAQSAVRMPGANPTNRNQLHAKTINGGKHYPADRHAPAQILWKSGTDFQTVASTERPKRRIFGLKGLA